MGLEKAIFDKKNGALVYYPSKIIQSSMKVLLQSSQKGPLVCSQALITISQYIKEIHRVDERLKDLLADIISSMKSQISFMAPAIAGVVVGITSMINLIIGKLGQVMGAGGLGDAGMEGITTTQIPQMFSDGIPTYFFQIVVGIYVVQIVYVLTVLSNGVENGADKLSEEYYVGRNLRNSTILYCVIAAIVMLIFSCSWLLLLLGQSCGSGRDMLCCETIFLIQLEWHSRIAEPVLHTYPDQYGRTIL
jgi:hypothetical protein